MATSSSARVTRSLYRSILRTSRLYSFPPHGKITSSFLHRSGIEAEPYSDNNKSSTAADESNIGDDCSSNAPAVSSVESSLSSTTSESSPLSHLEARDLTRGYLELKQLRQERQRLQDSVINSSDYDNDNNKPQRAANNLFRQLLREALTATTPNYHSNSSGSGDTSTEHDSNQDDATKLMRFPSQIPIRSNTSIIDSKEQRQLEDGISTMWDIVRKEFRASNDQAVSGDAAITVPHSKHFTNETRLQVAFMVMKELHTKLAYALSLGYSTSLSSNDHIIKNNNNTTAHNVLAQKLTPQAAKGVSLLQNNYLKPGTFLIANPLLNGYFSKTVICILDHSDEVTVDSNTTDGGGGGGGGTYGLVVNRNANVASSHNNASSNSSIALVKDVLQSDFLPAGVQTAFDDCTVREGGPVNLSVQMMYTCPTPELEERIGGRVLSTASDNSAGGDAVFFQGNITHAAQAVVDGELSKNDFAFVVGASCWESGQLESEMKRGYWLAASGPPEIAMLGRCECSSNTGDNVSADADSVTPTYYYNNDLWVSMMCALGKEEGDVARLMLRDDGINEYGDVSDNF